MADEVIVREATKADWPNIAVLLARADLPLAGAEDHLSGFVVAVRGEEVLGCAGLERYGTTGLLRSVAIGAAERGLGLGARLRGAHSATGRGAGDGSSGVAYRDRPRLLSAIRLPRDCTKRGPCPHAGVGGIHHAMPGVGNGDVVDTTGRQPPLKGAAIAPAHRSRRRPCSAGPLRHWRGAPGSCWSRPRPARHRPPRVHRKTAQQTPCPATGTRAHRTPS